MYSNQNARDAGTAEFAAMMKDPLGVLASNNISIIQLPCPELMVLGLGRGREASPLLTIRDQLESPESYVRLGRVVDSIIYQIKEYQAHGFRIIRTLGKNGSPTCGVRTIGRMTMSSAAEGFLSGLRQRLEAEDLEICIEGIDDLHQHYATKWILKRISDEATTG